MAKAPSGQYVTVNQTPGEAVRAFVPHPLPPRGLVIGPLLRAAFDRALVELGRLDAVATLLPATGLFLYTYIRKEAVLSSQIEGTQSSLSDLLLFELEEAPGIPAMDDVAEVSNYVAALQHGLTRVREGFPVSNRLLREVHGVLLAGGRGSEKTPGEFRRSQNWIGGTRPGNAAFVPPPPDRVQECMGSLELFLHDEPERTSAILKAALAHAQFETIHPFLDGNGRVGRLLITLLLCVEGILGEPLLYLSLYFKEHRSRYYELLDRVRTEGAWEEWLAFFAEAVETTARGAVETARQLQSLFAEDRERIARLGRGAGSALRLHHEMQRRPLSNASSLIQATGLAAPTVNRALAALGGLDIVRETTGRRRNRVFVYRRYLALLNSGTET